MGEQLYYSSWKGRGEAAIIASKFDVYGKPELFHSRIRAFSVSFISCPEYFNRMSTGVNPYKLLRVGEIKAKCTSSNLNMYDIFLDLVTRADFKVYLAIAQFWKER